MRGSQTAELLTASVQKVLPTTTFTGTWASMPGIACS